MHSIDVVVERNCLFIFEIRLFYYFSLFASFILQIWNLKVTMSRGGYSWYPAITWCGKGPGSSGGRAEREKGGGGREMLPQFLLVVALNVLNRKLGSRKGVGERNQSNPAVQSILLWLQFFIRSSEMGHWVM